MCAHVHGHAPRGDVHAHGHAPHGDVHAHDHVPHGDVHVYDHDLHDGVHAQIKADSYEIPPIFDMLAKDGDIAKEIPYAFP